ncbi:hypothetical protein GCM10009827_084280 [Dactylosporangium maewongense]|uniref:DUF1778 domain-containing protein n=1 Tax=Dactylosporangium maewongense TaxID=634393 RepID=A0ABP4MZ20_9ACTN
MDTTAAARKTERIEVRATTDEAERIELAAQVQHLSVSAFVVQAATSAADQVIARTDITLMPADQFDELMASLDEPDDMPGLARAFDRRWRSQGA